MTIKEAIQLLELTAPISKVALKKAYRDALMVWHPDRFADSTELKAKAEGRTYQINEAYALLSRIPESDYPYRASTEVPQTEPPPPSSPTRANASRPPQPRPKPPRQRTKPPQPSSPPKQAAAAPPKQPNKAPAKKRADIFTIAAWVICIPAIVFSIAFILQLQPRNKSAIQKEADKHPAGESPLSPDPANSMEEIRVKGQQGDKEAQFQLGQAYTNGDGVTKDPKEAVKWLQLAADQGHAEAQFNLGVVYANGEGVKEDPQESLKWFRKAAEQGESKAQYAVGINYQTGIGVPKNTEEAANWYRKAADQGHPYAQFYLALCYSLGDGLPKNAAEAMKWYHKAAVQGHAEAQCFLGEGYANGDGVPKDEAEAVRWYRRAANQGYAAAQFFLGGCYSYGHGVAKSEDEAAYWYQRAAKQGDADAQSYLGACYANGEGVTKDQIIGHMWLNLAGAKGVEKAKKNLLLLEAQMSAAQITEAQDLAVKFKPIKEDGQTPSESPILNDSAAITASAKNGRPTPEEMSDDEKVRQFETAAKAWDIETGRAFPDVDQAGHPLANAVNARVAAVKANDPDYFIRTPDAGYKLVASEAAKLGIAPISPPSKSFLSALPPELSLVSTPELRHLPSDERLTSGSILTDRLAWIEGKGKLILDNGLTEDAFVKMISNEKLVASFYVRGGEKFTFDHVPDGVYRLIYCTGFGWDSTRSDFERGRHAVRYDDSLDFTTSRKREGRSIITSTGVITLTLHKVSNGNTKTSDMPLDEFDRY
ncbi:MAG: DnaJ domain-containing protein [Prosthecobacter sp.]